MRITRLLLVLVLVGAPVAGDGKLVPPRDYKGSLEESAQEAILIFHGSEKPGEAVEEMILKITAEGAADHFAWVVPLPNEPDVGKADARLFGELFEYVEYRARSRTRKGKREDLGVAGEAESKGVEVLARRVVGSYDVATVRETEAGALNGWLVENGYQSLDNAEDVLSFYRRKGYVYACVRVSDAALDADKPVDLHPLRFTFKTGGRDAIYFPMRLTGLQRERFDVNLYVFHRYWINDRLSRFGYSHRGFRLRHRDWDTNKCKTNGGKAWSDPAGDPYLRDAARLIPTVTAFLQARHPGKRFYLTNIQAQGLEPDVVREWKDDLWLFPYYTDRAMVPHDARPGGVASGSY